MTPPISVIPESTTRVELADAKIAIGFSSGKYTSMNYFSLRAISRANKLFTNIRRIPWDEISLEAVDQVKMSKSEC